MQIRFSAFNKTVVAILLLALLCLTVCAQQKSASNVSSVDVLVQGAMDSELQPLLAALEEKKQIQLAAWTFWRGKIGSKTVVVSRTEIGTINAIAATTLAINTFKPKLILNQGTAGAHDPDLKVFDIVIGESTVDFSPYRSTHAAAGAGIDQSRRSPIPHRLRLDGKERVVFKNFPGDQEIIKTAMDTPYKRGSLVKGIIGSAFEFNKEIDRMVWIRKTFGTSSEDMESAFVAGTAAGFKTRFLAIRIISNSEFYSPKFEEIAGEYCAAFVVDVIKRLK